MSEERKAAERLAVKGFGAVAVIALAFWAVPQIWDKLSPFIIAIPLAAMLQPVVRFAHIRLKMKNGVTVLICVLLLLALLFGMTYWVVSIVMEQAPELVGQSGNIISESVNAMQQAAERLMNDSSSTLSPQVRELIRNGMNNSIGLISDWGTRMAADIVSFSVNLVTSLPYLVIYVSFLAMALYFITIHYEDIRSYLPGGRRRRQDSNTTQLTNSALRSLSGYLRVQGTFALMVFVVSIIALNVMRFRYASAIAVIAGVMEMIPMIGSGLLYIVMGVVDLLLGDTVAGIQVLALTGVLQLLRRILEPKIMSSNIGISPLLSLIGMFVGMRLGGVVGLIGGPVAMAVLVGAVRGDVFKGINDDLYLVAQWLKRRWAREEPAADPPAAGAEPLPDAAENTAENTAESGSPEAAEETKTAKDEKSPEA